MDERVAHDYIDHMIYEANGHADTDDQEVLAIRAKFEELYSSSRPRPTRQPKRFVRQAVCISSAPSVMNPAESTTSCAAVPAVRATPANPASTFRWRTTHASVRLRNVSRT